MSTVDIGTSGVGLPVQATFTVFNLGTAPLTGLSLLVDGTNATDFSAGPLVTNVLNAGESTSFAVTFTPGFIGIHTAAIHLASNDADENPFDINLVGTGAPAGSDIAVEQPVGSNLTDAVSLIDFGNAVVSNSTGLIFTIRNLGADPLVGLTASLIGGAAGDFVAGPLGTNALGAGESTTVTVTLTPSAAGARTAVLQIQSNDPDESPFDIIVTGTGTEPEIAVEQPVGNDLVDGVAVVDFGPVIQNSSTVFVFTVRNPGTANLLGLQVSVDGANASEFVAVRNGPPGAPPGGTRNITVTFTPTGPGVRTAVLRIASNDADENPFDIILTGTCVSAAPPPQLSIDQLGADIRISWSAFPGADYTVEWSEDRVSWTAVPVGMAAQWTHVNVISTYA
ncbi:MAG: choice-of-anchor D domain-containing protein, partial [Verrucomicrobiota bacterium]